MSALFTPYTLRSLTLPNRIVIAPMCEFSAVEGCATDWHIIHLGHLALSGAGLLIIEATAVEPHGRISSECLGLYSDDNERALGRVLQVVRRYSDMPIGIQLSHAGRKASTERSSAAGRAALSDERAWPTVGPSALRFSAARPVPFELDCEGMARIIEGFVQATQRAARLGLDMIEIHSAHGYLLSSFLSPIANHRVDAYGGSLENRMRFPLEVFDAVRNAWPAERPLGVRCNGTDWMPQGITPDDAVAYARALRDRGCDYVDVSSGGNAIAQIPLAPGYQVPFASKVRAEAAIPTMAVGLIRDPRHAESIVAEGHADMVALGRGMLNDPRWPWHAAEELGATVKVPYQYGRAATRQGIPAHDAIPAVASRSAA
ncbi:MAG: NADH:flavin oxidoreductase/NADH oxidase [Polaromonas sp.]|nr:NADH:flavin oxidoreductase/NADH oxidase [Gemmatimonadaceae bacterium]